MGWPNTYIHNRTSRYYPEKHKLICQSIPLGTHEGTVMQEKPCSALYYTCLYFKAFLHLRFFYGRSSLFSLFINNFGKSVYSRNAKYAAEPEKKSNNEYLHYLVNTFEYMVLL